MCLQGLFSIFFLVLRKGMNSTSLNAFKCNKQGKLLIIILNNLQIYSTTKKYSSHSFKTEID